MKKCWKVVGLSPNSSYTFILLIDPTGGGRGAKKSGRRRTPLQSRENSFLQVKGNEHNTRYRLSPVPRIVLTPSGDVTDEEVEVFDTDQDHLFAGISASQLSDQFIAPGQTVTGLCELTSEHTELEGSHIMLDSGSDTLFSGSDSSPSIRLEGPDLEAEKTFVKETEVEREKEIEVPEEDTLGSTTRIPSVDGHRLVVRFRTTKSGKHDAKLVAAIEDHNTVEVKRICEESPEVSWRKFISLSSLLSKL